MNCPISGPTCKGRIPEHHHFTCPQCWWLLATTDRSALGTMQKRGQDTTSKLEAAVRRYKEKVAR